MIQKFLKKVIVGAFLALGLASKGNEVISLLDSIFIIIPHSLSILHEGQPLTCVDLGLSMCQLIIRR